MARAASPAAGWLSENDVDIDELRALAELTVDPASVPHARAIEQRVPIYDTHSLDLDDPAVHSEWRDVLDRGPGIIVLEHAVERAVLDLATRCFHDLIAAEAAAGQIAGDHFAAPGTNSRVWEALGKLAEIDPATFVDYYASPALHAAARSWLGPWYQVTSQVNVVRPGGQAQEPHRDYHLGFLTNEQAAQFPVQVHRLSPALTLQGAVAHVDMPVDSGPTMFLPFSQRLDAGYLAWRLEACKDVFATDHIQLPLQAGDAVFFNPALFHGAGTNRTTDVQRMANLLQISSAFGRAMESVDRTRLCAAIAPTLAQRAAAGWTQAQLDRVIAAAADGYAFPANLDRTPPVGGLAPESQADLLRRSIAERWAHDHVVTALERLRQARQADPTPR